MIAHFVGNSTHIVSFLGSKLVFFWQKNIGVRFRIVWHGIYSIAALGRQIKINNKRLVEILNITPFAYI